MTMKIQLKEVSAVLHRKGFRSDMTLDHRCWRAAVNANSCKHRKRMLADDDNES